MTTPLTSPNSVARMDEGSEKIAEYLSESVEIGYCYT
jgi:hypothetical protein